jgi:hypothetical protein
MMGMLLLQKWRREMSVLRGKHVLHSLHGHLPAPRSGIVITISDSVNIVTTSAARARNR